MHRPCGMTMTMIILSGILEAIIPQYTASGTNWFSYFKKLNLSFKKSSGPHTIKTFQFLEKKI